MLRRIKARTLLNYTVDQLWARLTGRFMLVFDDGELATDYRKTIYSSYFWEYHRRFPKLPMLMRHHVSHVIGSGMMGSGTHLDLLGNVYWDTYNTYVAEHQQFAFFPNPENRYEEESMDEIDIRDILSRTSYEVANWLYNEMTDRLEAHITSLSILDFIQVYNHPDVKAANASTKPTQYGIEETYVKVKKFFKDSPDLRDNNLVKIANAGLVRMGQVLQALSPIGFRTDIDGWQFQVPIMSGYLAGVRDIYGSMVESRSASKAMAFTKAPLQDSEYFSRRLQLISMVLRNIHFQDCGTTDYHMWTVRDVEYDENGMKKRDSDLKQIAGKYYFDDEEGKLKTIKATDKHLIGKMLKMRTVAHCASKDQYGICRVCYGELFKAIPRNTNVGAMNSASMAQKISQNVMSTKHYDANALIEVITLWDENRKYLKVSPDGNSYMLTENLKDRDVSLIIRNADAPNLDHINIASDVRKLNITRLSEISSFSIMSKFSPKLNLYETHGLVVQKKNRKASLTHEMLEYIRNYGWTLGENDNYIIKMDKWNWNDPILALPMRHENMSDHAKAISDIVESSVKKKKFRDEVASPDDVLVELFDLTNEKISVNLAVMEVVLYTAMITSAANGDYALPKPWTRQSLGILRSTMKERSASALLAFQQQADFFNSPESYVKTNRMDHPFDWLLAPSQLAAAREKERRAERRAQNAT